MWQAIAELWIHLGAGLGFTTENWGRNFHFQVLTGLPGSNS
jgi:hypothetical protein